MLKVVVVGLGKIGQRHLDNWEQIDGCEIVGLVSRNQYQLDRFGKKYQAKTGFELKGLLNRIDADVVDICLPTYLHFTNVKAAAEAKVNIICEKPLALHVKEAREMIHICQQNQVQLYVGQTLRFFPAYAEAHNQVKNGAIGNPGVVRLSRGTAYPGEKSSWYGDASKSGGVILDLGVHDFDWLIWTFGDVERVMARHIQKRLDSENEWEYSLVTLRMANGTIAHVELSWAKQGLETSFEIAGDKGMLVNSSKETVPIQLMNRSETSAASYLPNNQLEESPFLKQLSHFKDCLEGKTEPIVTAKDSAKAIEVAEAAILSASLGQPVNLVEKGALR
ncbi:Gfo/Idh/MocA family protein [Aquibacillus salsiterrae]|uniref:Gfo/Idh/MocA family oxidoreductase n=1 Tax=Aquibacillus salsiterrae TaxID=2950439 RepID=A0A9X3WIE6_9BACI|nr:Gfo/Idh/MocA family oxidoreductase [Aquibacillus salsiterrae]MDC3418034.1 Gfo/Idh/MocA family oxidoreductase [Aquibacillus salsiterrae]